MKRRLIGLLIGILVIGGVYWVTRPATHVIINGPVVATRDQATFDQLGLIDAGQFEEWRTTGKVVVLDSGTEVLVVTVEAPRSRVRVLDGPAAGQELYVMTADIGEQ
jgi:hypothetical protein